MIFAGLRSRLALRFQLLIAVAAVLAPMGGLSILATTAKEANEYRQTLAADKAMILDALDRDLAQQLVIGDYATIEQILRQHAGRDTVDRVEWRDPAGRSLLAANAFTAVARPDWFAAWIAMDASPVVRRLEIGGVDYGQLTVTMSSMPLENRLWSSVRLNVAMFAAMVVAIFVLIAWLLHHGLLPLARLTAAAGEIGAGKLLVRATSEAGDAPEMRAALTAFNRMAVDIEALWWRLSEQRRAIDNAAIVSETDLAGNITYANRRFCELLGYTSAELVGQNHRIVNSGVHPPEFFADLWATIAAGRVWHGEICDRSKGGELRWLATSITPVAGADGRPEKFVAVRSDVTERRLAEAALRRSHEELEEKVARRTADLSAANESLRREQAAQRALIAKLEEAHNQLLQSEKMASIGQLAAGIAHEINNPVGYVNANLTTLRQYVADLLALLAAHEQAAAGSRSPQEVAALGRELEIDYLREDIGQLLGESLDGLQRVRRIVDDLKDFSRVGATEREWADLEKGLDSTLNVVWNEVKYKADVVREYAGIEKIECVPSQLNQVFMNLLVNAAQAIEGHGRITLRTGQDSAGVWVEVADTGQGIGAEHLGKIFDPFFTTKPVGKGTGLGLSVSYGIVQRHGGRIEVRSEVGRGSAFRVVLPWRAAAPDQSHGD